MLIQSIWLWILVFNPKLISEYSDEFELLTVEAKIGNKEVRVISGYGPQESWKEDERRPFFLTLDLEIERAKLNGKSVIIMMDANSKLGKEVINGDPHFMSSNGELLYDILKRNNLIASNVASS